MGQVIAHVNRPIQEDPLEVQWPPYGLPPSYTSPVLEDQLTNNPSVSQPQGLSVNIVTPPVSNQQVMLESQALNANPSAYNAANPQQVVVEVQPTPSKENVQSHQMLQMLEERLRAVEGDSYGIREATELCLVPDVVIPSKFKVLKFDKYKRTSCPKNHLTMYCRKMASHARDDKLLIHFFQDSLTGAALNWYMHLEHSRIHCWKDLVDAFLRQYKYNIDMAPDRLELQTCQRKTAKHLGVCTKMARNSCSSGTSFIR